MTSVIMNVEIHQSDLGHFGTWPYGTTRQYDGRDMDDAPRSRHVSHPAALFIQGGFNKNSEAPADASNPAENLSSEPTQLFATHTESPLGRLQSFASPGSYSRSNDSVLLRHVTPASIPIEGLSRSPQIDQTNVRTVQASLDEHKSQKTGLSSTHCALISTKRSRAVDDVDGPCTGHLSCKKRRLRLQLITSRLSLPFSLPATHILNRESDDDTPVISRFVKIAALRAKKAGHQTTLVRKAAILNRVRLNVRQTAITRGHDRIWWMTRMGAMSHGVQLVTDSTGAMFPGRSGEQVPGPIVPQAWRPHTTAALLSPSTLSTLFPDPVIGSGFVGQTAPLGTVPISPYSRATCQDIPPPTSIMTPLAGADEDEASFPDSDLDSRYANTSDDDMDDVYADFGALFGGGGSSDEPGTDDHFYEEYLDEVDGIVWGS